MTSSPLPGDGWECLMDAESIERVIRRMASQIAEEVPDLSQALLVGIPNRGVELSDRLAKVIRDTEGIPIETGIVDISMHRDDLRTRDFLPSMRETILPTDLDSRDIVLVDDVYFTGRTCRAALDALLSFGRPARVRYAVLIDRNHPELPIRPDYVGRHFETRRDERVAVRFRNIDEQDDGVWLKRL
jgi:pyrimidine operon attenuation protein/uracil phosphoribosyltransferase